MCQLSESDNSQLLGAMVVMGAFCFVAYWGWFDRESYSEQIVRWRRHNPIWKRHPTEALSLALLGARFLAPIGAMAVCAAITELITYCQT